MGRYFVCRLPDDSSVYSAELSAIHLALKFILESPKHKFIIFTDSLSCLHALHGSSLKNPLLVQVINAYMEAASEGNDIAFCWVPSHVGIAGNENADATAKAALNLVDIQTQVPHNDFRGSIVKYILSKWQMYWESDFGNKLLEIQPEVGSSWANADRRDRREEVVLARLRIGHTHLTHSHLLKGERPPVCDWCGQPLTVKHLLVECNRLSSTRNRFYQTRNMKDLFTSTDPSAILKFLKAINVYNKL